MRLTDLPAEVNQTSGAILDSAIEVHNELGTGLLEIVYKRALSHELILRGHAVALDRHLPVHYKGVAIHDGYYPDIIVDGRVIVETKAVRGFEPAHEAQLLNYMRLSGIRVGWLINFHASRIREGYMRRVL